MARWLRGALVITLLAVAVPAWSEAPAASPKASQPTGKLSRADFEEALRAVRADLNACYDRALRKDAIGEGEVMLVIETQGGKNATADTDRQASSLKLEDAHRCIAKVVKTMKMPIAKGPDGKPDPRAVAVVRYPLAFSLGIDLSSGSPQQSGAKLDPDAIKRVFSSGKQEIAKCYLLATKANRAAAAKGKLGLKIDIVGGKATRVEPVAADTTVTDAEMKSCIVDTVKSFSFPVAKDARGVTDPRAASVVTYPMQFE
jgi:hypothetical protein